MTASRSKVPAIGSAQWILEERHQSNDLVAQELEDFGFSVRNELEWLNEHMADIFAKDSQHNLDVFKTPGKLRGKTPHTTRKRTVAEPRQPLANLFAADLQQRATPAEQGLRENAQRSTVKSKFEIAKDTENETPVKSAQPLSPVVRQLFSKAANDDREQPVDSFYHELSDEHSPPQPAPPQWASFATQDTAFSSQANDIFSPPRTQTTQATQSFRYSMHDLEDEENKDKDAAEDSFVSAIDAFRSKTASNEDLREQAQFNDALLDEDFEEDMRTESRGTVVHHDIDADDNDEEEDDMQDISHFPKPPRVSDAFSIGAETHEALDTANHRAHAPEPKMLLDPIELDHSYTPAGAPPASPQRIAQDDMDAHVALDDDMEVDEEPTPSEHSSPVKPLVRKSSLTFACLPAREPILPKKSMGRTSQIRHTGGKSLGASQIVQSVDSRHDDVDIDDNRPALQREESETTKTHNKTSTQRLFERFQMLEQHAPPKRISQNLLSQSSRPSAYPSQPKEAAAPAQTSQSQPTYPTLPTEPERDEPEEEEDDDDSWIAAPTKTTASAANPVRPPINKSHTIAIHSSPLKLKPSPIKLVSTSNPDLSAAVDSTTTPVGSPVGKKYTDAPLSASKAKFYSALRAAKDKLIGSTAASAQVKLDGLSSPKRPELQPAFSSDDLPSSPKRAERPISLFSHMRSPSKDSIKSSKSTKSAKTDKAAEAPGSPVKERKTRSSTEREKAKEREAREKELLHKQKSEDKLREMREKEQSKAAAYHKKTASASAIAKTPSQMSSQASLKPALSVNTAPKPAPRPDTVRLNSAPKDQGTDSADEMPPPPPPKSLLPTFPTTKVRPPKKLVKPNSKDALAKPQEPQKIFIKNQYARAPPPAARPAPVTTKSTGSSTLGKSTSSKPTAATLSRPGTAMANKVAPTAKSAPNTLKAPPPKASRPQPQAAASFEKPKSHVPQARADLAAARAPTSLRTVQDANSIRVPPVNTAKPPKRALDNNETETIQRPPKRPSQLKQNPITPGHPSQYAKGKIPGLESALASHSKSRQPSMQYPNGDDIKLPEIMTDSEDEDSDNEFEQPSWVNTPNLREMLSTQQLMDPEAIFGPIAPLNMEQVFPNKERHKRFRERTSSAYWVHDQVTDEEKRKEREARERLVREGAWTYNPSPRPTPRSGPSH
ncbi:hypothetical protein E8E11_010598 [Didymella keratinophila]|nr:hypothetical protein E8E11_010598 [Didymella keratinophila]